VNTHKLHPEVAPKNALVMIAGTKRLILMLKGIVHQILRGVNIKLNKSVLVNWRPAFFSF
jgi:hypothetical protein